MKMHLISVLFLLPTLPIAHDYMTRCRKVEKVQDLTNSLSAPQARQTDPYAVYGTEISRLIPGSKQFWRSFGLDIVAFVEQRASSCL